VPENVTVVEGDFLDVDIESLFSPDLRTSPVRVIGNLPYNIASLILLKLLRSAGNGRRFTDATLMLQQEVADRIVASPGTRDYGTLGIQVGLVAAAEGHVCRGAPSISPAERGRWTTRSL
jgi:16S rRNA (adenine1518-N6/adenine1519-N6)-dimethyltransferase